MSKREPRLLAEVTLQNTGSSPAKMAEAVGYFYDYTNYWGQGIAMFKGLNTGITLDNKTQLPDIKWGIPVTENRTSLYT